MRLAVVFVDPALNDYTPVTPATAPLGGTQSAVYHLGPALVRRGAAVTLVNGTTQPGTVRGVHVRHARRTPAVMLAGFDAVVIMSAADPALLLLLRALRSSGLWPSGRGTCGGRRLRAGVRFTLAGGANAMRSGAVANLLGLDARQSMLEELRFSCRVI